MFLIVWLLSATVQPGGAASGFEAGRQAGYALGQGLIAAVITWAILKYVLKRA
ncbi:MAG TPA: hypothetical protein VIF63_07395 [Candidatus Limnocylindrales bacterium]